MSGLKRRLLNITVLGALLWVLVPVANAQTAYPFDLPAQPLAESLRTVGHQTGMNIMFEPRLVKNLRAPALRTRTTAAEALRLLLVGTQLSAVQTARDSILIQQAPQDSAASKETARVVPADSQDIRLARAQALDAAATGEPQDPATAQSKGIPELLVKGHRSLNADIQRTEDEPQPYVVFDREDIQRSQALNLGDFFKTRLPMNTAANPPQPGGTQATGGSDTASSINLRGLGANQTLIVIDGRRVPGRAALGEPNQPDLNGIPIAAVERIEVLPSTAGGIYGGSATGGVINIVLRRDFSGIEARATYANTFDSDAANMRLDATAGFALEGGRTQVMITATHSTANKLLIGDRDFSQRAIALTLANNPAAIIGGASPPLGATVNILSADVIGGVRQPLVLDVVLGGASLGSTSTHLPLGYAGPESDNGAKLIANAGTYNLDIPNDVNGRQRGLLAVPSMEAVSLNVRRSFGERLDAFLDLSQLDDNGRSTNAAAPNFVARLPAGAPKNPFQQNIVVRFPTPSLPSFDRRSESSVLRATGGLIVRLPGQWTAEADYGWNRSRYKTSGVGGVLDSAGTLSLSTGQPAPDGRPLLNVLQEANGTPIDFSPYLLPAPNNFAGPFDTHLKDLTVRASGPALALPAGPVNLSMLVERRAEVLDGAFFESVNSTTREFESSYFPSKSQRIDSYYAEARVPLISAKNARPFARELELQASARHDRYTTRQPFEETEDPNDYATNRARSTDYTLGLRFAPAQDFAVRASFGTGFLPPSVSQIAQSVSTLDFSLGTDPRRGDTSMYVDEPFTYIAGGNAQLKPERSKSWSAGVIFTPRVLSGLRLSVDYTHISKVDEILLPDAQFLLDREDLFPERVVRGEKLDTDPADWAGPVTSIDTSLLNVARTALKAFDTQADYTHSTDRFGQFHAYVLATWQPHYRNQPLPDSPVIDSVGFSDGALEWRGNLGLDWDRGPLSVRWNAQYFDSYRVYSSVAAAPQIATAVLRQGSAKIPSQAYHDLIATYRFEHEVRWLGGWLADSEISFGIQNLFDKSPPILAAISPSSAGYSTYGDPRLRRYSISFRKSL